MVSAASGWKRTFFTVWTGQQFSLIGSQLVQFALVWWLTKTTGSATVLATATLVALLPQVVLGPFVGTLVDRWNRRRVMIVADSAIALVSLWLAYVFFTGSAGVWQVFLAMALRAVGGGFHYPAMSASTSLMVPHEQLARVAGLNQTMQGAANIVTPPLGAILLSLLPMHWILGIDVATAAIAVGPLLFVAIPQPEPGPAGAARPSVLREMREGFRYVLAWPGLLLVVLMAMLLNFVLSPGASLLPLFVTQHLRGGALQLGWLESCLGGGVVAGGLLLAAWGGFRRRIVTTLVGIVGMGAGAITVGLVPQSGLWIAAGAFAVIGMTNAMANGPLQAILQSHVVPRMQGRVFTLVGSLASAMSPLGLALAGPLADIFGISFWYVLSGCVLAFVGLGALFIPAVVRLEDHAPTESAPEPETVRVPEGAIE